MHVEKALTKDTVSPAYKDFLRQAAAVLPPDKYAVFESLVRFPLPSTKLTKKIFEDLARVWEGEDAAVRHLFTEQADELNFEEYCKAIKMREFWTEDYMEAVETSINSFLVVDMPTELLEITIQGTADTLPQPYTYVVHMERVLVVDVNRDNECEYLIYRESDTVAVALDDDYYRVFDLVDSKWVLRTEEPHVLRYCPAKPLWSDYLRPQNNFIEKEGPITAALSDLDEYNFWKTCMEYHKLTGAFPFMWEYTDDCTYVDAASGLACNEGIISGIYNEMVVTQNCPVCEANKKMGPGTLKQVPAPAYSTDADLREPLGIINVDKDALEFNANDLVLLRNYIVSSCVGEDSEAVNDKAVNEKQVGSLFESKANVLNRFKRNIEVAMQWANETLATLRYGADRYKGSVVSLGTRFYLKTVTELSTEYELRKKNGMPNFVLAATRRALLETEYKTNSEMREKAELLSMLEPYPDYTAMELIEMDAKAPGVIGREELMLKLDFNNYIDRFEREQLPILRFGSGADLKVKITNIKKVLLTYVKEIADKEQERVDKEREVKMQEQERLAAAKPGAQQPPNGGKSKQKQPPFNK